MAGRTTRKRPEAELTVEERTRLADARAVVAELSDWVSAPSELSELGYEQRMARARALELAVSHLGSKGWQGTAPMVVGWAQHFYAFIWRGETEERK